MTHMSSQPTTPGQACTLCTEPAIEVLPVLRETGADEVWPGVPVCATHKREFVADQSIVGRCLSGRHYGPWGARCFSHGDRFTSPMVG
jgi:hypothetical protein